MAGTRELAGFVHRFEPAARGDARTLLLLHGTGGNESDLLPLGRMLDAGAALLSPRGQVMEHGMPRFFRRHAEGVFDVPDLKRRADALAAFVREAGARYGFDTGTVIAVGFSNGANIGAALMLEHTAVLRGALLYRAVAPFEPERPGGLEGVRVFLSAGRRDPLAPPDRARRLADLLRLGGAEVTLRWDDGGHGLGPAEIRAGRDWLAGIREAGNGAGG